MTLGQYLEAVHRMTGVREVESFWVHSTLLSVEVFCVVAAMAWLFLRTSRYAESVRAPAIRSAAPCVLLAAYCLVLGTSLLLFFQHEQVRQSFNQTSARDYAYVGAALAFFLVGWSPVFYLFWRKQRLSPNGA
jgi:hypothetical protein